MRQAGILFLLQDSQRGITQFSYLNLLLNIELFPIFKMAIKSINAAAFDLMQWCLRTNMGFFGLDNLALTIQLQHGKNAPSTTKPFSAPLAAPIKLRET